MADSSLTQSRLRYLLRYDPDTGLFWRLRGVQGFAKGVQAGSLHKASGYIYIGVDRKSYRAHRLAWFYMTGEWPSEIDHINRERADNRWRNLRVATRSQNNVNSRVRSDNSSGVTGVIKRGRRWSAYITEDGRQNYLGTFATKPEAIAARNNAALAMYGEFADA